MTNRPTELPDLHRNDPRFVEYYREASQTDSARQRALGILLAVLRLRKEDGRGTESLDVADIGCNAGTQSRCWLEQGHRVHGLDVSRDLVEEAQRRLSGFGGKASFVVGTAERLPWPDESFDVVLLPELLEHVQDWEIVLREAVRVLRPTGNLYVSTTNVLCPVQEEFNLPAYSWYPGWLKRRILVKATTTSPQLVNFATFPAYHWFSPYGLRRFLTPLGMTVRDRFDAIDLDGKGGLARFAVTTARKLAFVRFLGHVLTPGTTIVATKLASAGE